MANRLTQFALEALVASPNARETQQAREVLTGPGSPNVRETQQVREALTGPGNPNIRETQQAREVLAKVVPTSARLTQIAEEILQQGGSPNARLTQVAEEILASGGSPNARLTQVAVETLETTAALVTNARLTQIAEEILQVGGSPNARLTQIAEEILETVAAVVTNARLTQIAEEILSQGGSPNARLTQIAEEILEAVVATGPPEIITTTPPLGSAGSSGTIVITGTNMSGATVTSDPGITITGTTSTSTSVTVTYTIPSTTNPGARVVTVTTPFGADTTNFIVTSVNLVGARDCLGDPARKVKEKPPKIVPNPLSISLSCPSATSVNIGATYSSYLVVSGGTAPYSYYISGGTGHLPAGITLDQSTGLISGVCSDVAGNYPFPATVSDWNGLGASISCSITVNATGIFLASPPTLDIVTGFYYGDWLRTTGGTAPFSYSLISGSLPPGITITPSTSNTAVVSGTSTTVGNYFYTIQVSDSGGLTATCSSYISVLPGALHNWTDISGAHYVGGAPRTSPNDSGPFYHGGYVYFIFSSNQATGSGIVAFKSVDGENWTQAGASLSGITSPAANMGESIGEYKSGSIHKAYLIYPEGDTVAGPTIYHTSLFQYDFTTETFSRLTTMDALTYPTLRSSQTLSPPNAPANYASLGYNDIIVRVDPNTGYVYFFTNGPPVTYTCPYDGVTQLYYDTLGYYIWNGTSWSSYHTVYAGARHQSVAICQAFIDSASNIYVVYATIVTVDSATDCTIFVNPGIAFSVYKNAALMGTFSSYFFNNPGCPPYDQPNMVVEMDNIYYSYQDWAVPFSYNCSLQLVSRFVELSGHVYFACPSTTRTVDLYDISSTGMVKSNLASNVDLGEPGPSVPSYSHHVQPFINQGQLAIMWFTEDWLPPAHKDGKWHAAAWRHLPDNSCSAAIFYPTTTYSDLPNVNWTYYSGGAFGTINKISLNYGNLGTGGDMGLMPYIVPSNGTYYQAGDVTFAISNRGSWATFATPLGIVGSHGTPPPVPPTISCPLTAPTTVGVPFSDNMIATGGHPPYTFSLIGGALPPGLTLSSSGVISGTPTTAGVYNYTIQVTDTTPLSSSVTCGANINPPPTPPLNTALTCS